MLPRPPERVRVGVAGDARHMLIRLDHEGVIGRVHPGCGAVHAGQGEQLARDFGHEDHHGRVGGEPLGAELLPDGRPDLRQVAGGHGRSLEIYVSPHVSQDAGGLYLRGPCQRLLALVRGVCHPCAAQMVGHRRRRGGQQGLGLDVDPCWTLRSGTSTRRMP